MADTDALLLPAPDDSALERLRAFGADHDLCLVHVAPAVRLGMEAALDRMSFDWRPLSPTLLCVLLPRLALDRAALLALCAADVPCVWLWDRRGGWQAVRPTDGRVLHETRDPLGPFGGHA